MCLGSHNKHTNKHPAYMLLGTTVFFSVVFHGKLEICFEGKPRIVWDQLVVDEGVGASKWVMRSSKEEANGLPQRTNSRFTFLDHVQADLTQCKFFKFFRFIKIRI